MCIITSDKYVICSQPKVRNVDVVETDLVESYDVRVLQKLHDFNLSSDLTTILSIQPSLINDLNGNLERERGRERERERKRERERGEYIIVKNSRYNDTGIHIPTRHFKCLSIP